MKTAKNPEKKRFRLFSYLFNTRMGTMIFSIITAIFLWFAIAATPNKSNTHSSNYQTYK